MPRKAKDRFERFTSRGEREKGSGTGAKERKTDAYSEAKRVLGKLKEIPRENVPSGAPSLLFFVLKSKRCGKRETTRRPLESEKNDPKTRS